MEKSTGGDRGGKFPYLGSSTCWLQSLARFSVKHLVIDAGCESKGTGRPA